PAGQRAQGDHGDPRADAAVGCDESDGRGFGHRWLARGMTGYLGRLTAYAQRVLDGVEVAGKWERLACARFFRDLGRQNTDEFPYVLDERAGTRECYFLELLPHIKGEWAKPVYIEGGFQYAKLVLEAWQIFIEFQPFRWLHRA